MKKKYAVVFVHGLAKKPSPEKLEHMWRWGLERSDTPLPFGDNNPGIDLDTQGVPGIFNYYADVFYGTDYEMNFDSYYESESDVVVKGKNFDYVAGELATPEPASAEELKFLEELERKMREVPSPVEPAGLDALPPTREASPLEIASWLPDPIKQAVIKKAAMEAYYFLFNKDYVRPVDGVTFKVRQELRSRLINDLRVAAERAEKLVLVAHSLGTIIAYDVIRNCENCPPVDVLFTLGSPLGITEVQERLLAKGKAKVDFPPALGRWINVYDPLDPICGADPKMVDFDPFEDRKVYDVRESNWGSWRHTITHYFAGRRFRTLLADVLGLQRR
ncbi:hypothetical protein [Pseudomonas fluorescens]|uniref:Alpha/beta hydrolase n=1 Tax=Pseudomonas fluorescens TaxID=294 RepID=A0A5E7VU44_PSEFL|nr:hypothetical protein [Pseudomonas fluorescens]VVQ26361.1 hypothetical protein PS928_06523 [Pseudomonas fluorescens]